MKKILNFHSANQWGNGNVVLMTILFHLTPPTPNNRFLLRAYFLKIAKLIME